MRACLSRMNLRYFFLTGDGLLVIVFQIFVRGVKRQRRVLFGNVECIRGKISGIHAVRRRTESKQSEQSRERKCARREVRNSFYTSQDKHNDSPPAPSCYIQFM